MLAIVIGVSLGVSSLGPQLVRPGMPFHVAQALLGEKPQILNRTNDKIRVVEYPRAGITLTLDDAARVVLVNGKGEEISAEKELERLAKALRQGFEIAELEPLLFQGEKPDQDAKMYGYSRLRVARMTSDTTAKITVSFYLGGHDPEEEYETLILHLSWYRGWWFVTKFEGDPGTEHKRRKLFSYIDGVSGNGAKP